MLYYEDPNLTEEELTARDNMIYLFNPCLKTFIAKVNGEMFKQWNFNCCRQTAIIGSAMIVPYLPGYDIKAYEINYDDIIDGHEVNYEHCVIIAQKDARRLIIDIARTSKPLVFALIPEESFDYPEYPAYKDVKRNWVEEINWKSWTTRGMYEYLTHCTPEQIYAVLCRDMAMLAVQPEEKILDNAKQVYDTFTQIEKSA